MGKVKKLTNLSTHVLISEISCLIKKLVVPRLNLSSPVVYITAIATNALTIYWNVTKLLIVRYSSILQTALLSLT